MNLEYTKILPTLCPGSVYSISISSLTFGGVALANYQSNVIFSSGTLTLHPSSSSFSWSFGAYTLGFTESGTDYQIEFTVTCTNSILTLPDAWSETAYFKVHNKA